MTGQEKNVSSCAKGGLDWILGKKFFMDGVVKLWNKLSREVVESSPLGMFSQHLVMPLEDKV